MGGADTKLDHLIDLLLAREVKVHLVPMFGADEIMRRDVLERGCEVHAYRDGYGANAARAIRPPPFGMVCQTWDCNAISSAEFFRGVDTMIHKTGTSEESYCRVLVEAYAHGVVPIVEAAYAFPELVVQGETGFMTSDSEEMSYHGSTLAFRPNEHRRLAENGRAHLETIISADEVGEAGRAYFAERTDATWSCAPLWKAQALAREQKG